MKIIHKSGASIAQTCKSSKFGCRRRNFNFIRRQISFKPAFVRVSNPFSKALIQGGLSFALGNYISQTASGEFDKRTWKMEILYGALVSTPISFCWYVGIFRGGLLFLPRMFCAQSKALVTITQICTTMLFLAPAQMVASTIYHELSERHSDICRTIHQSLPDQLATCWKVWPPMLFMNFFFIPASARILSNHIQNVAWAAVMGLMQ